MSETAGQHRLEFGRPITAGGQVILLQIMAHVESFASCEGIFRKSGSKHRVDQLVRDLGEREFQQILLSVTYKPHDYTSMLKQFFSELPESLLLKRHLDAYMQTAGEKHSLHVTKIHHINTKLAHCSIFSHSSLCSPALSTPAAMTKSLQLLMLLLPPSHRIVAQHLLQLLSFVASCAQSKMDAHNLALVFAPTLFLSGPLKAQVFNQKPYIFRLETIPIHRTVFQMRL